MKLKHRLSTYIPHNKVERELIDLCSASQLCLAFSLASHLGCINFAIDARERGERTIKAVRVQKASYQSHAIKITSKALFSSPEQRVHSAHKFLDTTHAKREKIYFPREFSLFLLATSLCCVFFDAIKSATSKCFALFSPRIRPR